MPAIKIKEFAPFEQEFRRFKRTCDKANISDRYKAKAAYEKPTTRRRRMKIAALKAEYNENKKYKSL